MTTRLTFFELLVKTEELEYATNNLNSSYSSVVTSRRDGLLDMAGFKAPFDQAPNPPLGYGRMGT